MLFLEKQSIDVKPAKHPAAGKVPHVLGTDLKKICCWINMRGTGITLDEAKELVRIAKKTRKQDNLIVFDSMKF